MDLSTKGWLNFQVETGHWVAQSRTSEVRQNRLMEIVRDWYPHIPDWALIEFIFAERWVKLGCPQVVLSDKLFAELTLGWDLSGANLDIPLPWPAFVIRIPEKLKPRIVWEGSDLRYPVSHLTVEELYSLGQDLTVKPRRPESAKYRLTLHIEGAAGSQMINFNSSAELGQVPPDATSELGEAVRALSSFAGAVLLEMMHPRHAAKLDRCKTTCEARSKAGDRRPTTLELVRPVTVDLRGVLRDVMTPAEDGAPAKKRAKVKLQSLIRGHYKRQRFGKGNTQVKYIYVDPYWRGPVDAPIAVREHILKA